jgi:photosystem II stability/assembly factor-like uncharacterized protein
VLAAVLVILLPGHGTLSRPLRTAWEPARELPQAANTGAGSSSGSWRLASYLISVGWQRGTAGPEPGYLTCPTASACYVEGDNATSASGPADMDSLYVSSTAGISWSVLPVPAGLTFTTAMSCSSASDCAAGGSYNGQPVFVRTADGGHSWTIDPLPSTAIGVIFQLSCPTNTTCYGLLTTSQSQLPLGQQYYGGVTFLSTTDAGSHFGASAFPAGQSMQALSCPATGDCVAIGASSADLGANSIAYGGFVQSTRNGGATWTPGRFPAHFSLGPFPQVTCPDAAHCFILGTSNPRTGYGAVAVSADGGRTWAKRPPPGDVPQPQLSEMSCPTDSTCYVSGSEAVAQRFPGGVNGGSAVILATDDAGLQWRRITFPVPRYVPARMQIDAFMSVGGIQCPQVNACVALGVSDQGSRSTPVYTDSPDTGG